MITEQNFNNQTSSDKPNKTTKALKFIFILAFVVLVGMIGAFYFILNKDKIELQKQLESLSIVEDNFIYEENFSNANLEEAVSTAEKLVNDYPDQIKHYILLANAYLQIGSINFNEVENADKAIEVLEKAITLDSRNSEVYRLLGYAYEIKQDYKKSLDMYNISIEIDPNNDVAYSSRGHMYYLAGNDKLAEADYKKSLSINPNNDKALLDLATLYFKNTENLNIDVEELLLRSIAISDNVNIKAEALQILGTYYFSLGDYKKAEVQFKQSVELEERLAMSWTGLATTKILLLETVSDDDFDSEVRQIIEYIEKALTLNENLSRAYVAEGLISGYLGDFAAEKEAYQKALSSIDKDITLSRSEKGELRVELDALIKEL